MQQITVVLEDPEGTRTWVAQARELCFSQEAQRDLDALIAALGGQGGPDKATLREAFLRLAHAIEPDERYDPADDPRRPLAAQDLALLVGPEVAEAAAEAFNICWTTWMARRRLRLDQGA